MTKPAYYVVQTGPDRYDMRQTRYKAVRDRGGDHPHDLMAVGFTARQMDEMLAKHFLDASIDRSALPEVCRHVNVEIDLNRAGGTASCTDCGATEARA